MAIRCLRGGNKIWVPALYAGTQTGLVTAANFSWTAGQPAPMLIRPGDFVSYVTPSGTYGNQTLPTAGSYGAVAVNNLLAGTYGTSTGNLLLLQFPAAPVTLGNGFLGVAADAFRLGQTLDLSSANAMLRVGVYTDGVFEADLFAATTYWHGPGEFVTLDGGAEGGSNVTLRNQYVNFSSATVSTEASGGVAAQYGVGRLIDAVPIGSTKVKFSLKSLVGDPGLYYATA
jgi:hypothetical protein